MSYDAGIASLHPEVYGTFLLLQEQRAARSELYEAYVQWARVAYGFVGGWHHNPPSTIELANAGSLYIWLRMPDHAHAVASLRFCPVSSEYELLYTTHETGRTLDYTAPLTPPVPLPLPTSLTEMVLLLQAKKEEWLTTHNANASSANETATPPPTPTPGTSRTY